MRHKFYRTGKIGLRHSRPQPGCHLPNSPRAGIIYVSIPAQGESLTFFALHA
jgi:hypothetical protein